MSSRIAAGIVQLEAAVTSAAEELRRFARAVAKAAGSLEGLPDGHAFVIAEAAGEFGEPDPGQGFITAGMIRRAVKASEP